MLKIATVHPKIIICPLIERMSPVLGDMLYISDLGDSVKSVIFLRQFKCNNRAAAWENQQSA